MTDTWNKASRMTSKDLEQWNDVSVSQSAAYLCHWAQPTTCSMCRWHFLCELLPRCQFLDTEWASPRWSRPKFDLCWQFFHFCCNLTCDTCGWNRSAFCDEPATSNIVSYTFLTKTFERLTRRKGHIWHGCQLCSGAIHSGKQSLRLSFWSTEDSTVPHMSALLKKKNLNILKLVYLL